jgi:hypothetical protein
MDVWIGGLAVDGRSVEQVRSVLTDIFIEGEYERCEGNDVDVVGDERALIIGGTKGWTSVYLERFENDAAVAVALSKELSTTVLCHRSVLYDAFAIVVYLDGDLIDEYQSCPDYFKAYDQPDSTAEELEQTAGDAEVVKAAVSRIDEALLTEIYDKSRLTNLAEQVEPEMSVPDALKALRKALKIGTLEHSFDDLWYGAEEFSLKAEHLGFLSLNKEPTSRWGIMKKRAKDSRDRWRSGTAKVKDKIAALKSKWPLKGGGHGDSKVEPDSEKAGSADDEQSPDSRAAPNKD